jgi:hypothetical protein
MGDRENTADGSGYTIRVNPDVAFTIIYDDAEGRLLFSIEVGDDPKTIFLNPWPSEGDQMVNVHDEAIKARVDLALKRVEAYFKNKGLTVEID